MKTKSHRLSKTAWWELWLTLMRVRKYLASQKHKVYRAGMVQEVAWISGRCSGGLPKWKTQLMIQQMPYHPIVIAKELGETGGRMWVMKKIQQKLALHSWDAFEWNDFGNPRFLCFPQIEFLNLISDLPCCCSVTWLYSTIRNPIDCSRPGCPILHHFTEFAQTPAKLLCIE